VKIAFYHKLIIYKALAKRNYEKKGHKSVIRQCWECFILFLLKRIGPFYYLAAHMGAKEAGWSYILGFYSAKEYRKRVRQINSRLFHKISQNKAIEKALLTAYGIPTPRLIGHFHPVIGIASNGNTLRTAENIETLLANDGAQRISFKLSNGCHGSGFRAVEVFRGKNQIILRDMSDGKETNVSDFVDSLGECRNRGMIIEEYMVQHPDIAKFNSSSVNTLRVMVYRRQGEQAFCFGAFMRVGRVGVCKS